MARVAGDFALALKIVFVDGHRHLDHLACDFFGLLVVFVESEAVILAHVTEFAFDAQRRGDEFHRREHLIRRKAFEHLDVFELLLGEFGRNPERRRERRRLGAGGDEWRKREYRNGER